MSFPYIFWISVESFALAILEIEDMSDMASVAGLKQISALLIVC